MVKTHEAGRELVGERPGTHGIPATTAFGVRNR